MILTICQNLYRKILEVKEKKKKEGYQYSTSLLNDFTFEFSFFKYFYGFFNYSSRYMIVYFTFDSYFYIFYVFSLL